MIMTRNLTLPLLAAAAILAGCSHSEEPAVVADDGGVKFSAQFNDISRATETSFENGDVIGVFAIEEIGRAHV